VEALFAILFSRVLSTYEAALLVTQRGMKQQVETLIRCTLEPLFPLVATSGDHSFAYKLVKAEEHKQLSAINKLIGYKERNGIYHADLAVAKELAKELGTKISREKLPKVNVLDCARRQTLRIDMIQFMP
jgi:hypothetical protein